MLEVRDVIHWDLGRLEGWASINLMKLLELHVETRSSVRFYTQTEAIPNTNAGHVENGLSAAQRRRT